MAKILISFFAACLLTATIANGQTFLDQQMQYPVFRQAFEKKNDLLKNEFKKKGLTYPAHYIFVRSFKYDSKLEVWVKNKPTDTFALFKTYHICALSGMMGRKQFEGDRQVPEGFYYINRFNPRSTYHLALKVNYPNFSDRLKNAHSNLGGGIYIHGSCVTVGCIPITNDKIDELYILAVQAKNMGQNYIPVHIFPISFNNKKAVDYLSKNSKTDDSSQKFWIKMKEAYDYFNATHKLPVILYDSKGDYMVEAGRAVTPLKTNYSTNHHVDKSEIPTSLMN